MRNQAVKNPAVRKWTDITRAIDDSLITWPGRARPQHRWEKSLRSGDHCNVSFWQMSAHSGTHMDAPLHFVADGRSIDQIPADVFLGICQVVDLCSLNSSVMDEKLAQQYRGTQRLLIRTAHSACTAQTGYLPHEALLSEAAAAVLIDGGLRLIGTDRLSIDDSAGRAFALHHKLLGAGCVIVEGLLLSDISAGSYDLYAAPLRFTNVEASPIRAFCSPILAEESDRASS